MKTAPKLDVTTTVGDLMSEVVLTAKADDTIWEAHSAMRISRIRHLPVLDGDELLGIVSDRDLYLGWSRGADGTLADVMSHKLQWVHPETAAHVAASRLLQHKIGALLVLDGSRSLVGILTETDFLRVAERALGGEATPA